MTDRVTIAGFSLAAFLLVLALLGMQLGHASSTHTRPRAVLLRRIYQTTVIERVPATAKGATAGTSVTQSVSGASALAPATPVTRTS
ncbi:MAG TPA: hypothetical protein VK272_06250 [Solirubrobacteraceae bacterium]|nr:hypothetical protein [Solirubrobacteraceae bacterium]